MSILPAFLPRREFILRVRGDAGRLSQYAKEESMNMSTETTTPPTTSTIQLTDIAAGKVAALLAQEGRDDLALRVAVQPGGCSGLRYQLYFDDRDMEGDSTHLFGAVKVIVDKMSDPYLAGATIDFVDTIEKQGFTIDNPNAGGSCACGDSFH